jgi:hypothetical protein
VATSAARRSTSGFLMFSPMVEFYPTLKAVRLEARR